MKYSVFIKLCLVGFMLIYSLTSCHRQPLKTTEVVVASYKDEMLTKHNLESSLPSNMTSADSIEYVTKYINRWILDRVLAYEAQKNLRNIDEIEKQVSFFRRELLNFYYLKEIAMQDSSKWLVSHDDVFNYYVSHEEEFISQSNYLKYIYLKVPRTEKNIASLRKDVFEGDIEALEFYENANANSSKMIDLKVVDKQWVRLDALDNIYSFIKDKHQEIAAKKNIEIKDNQYYYFFSILDFCARGSKSPLDLVSSDLEGLLKEKKKKNFINDFEMKVLQDNLRRGDAVINKDTTTMVQNNSLVKDTSEAESVDSI